MKRLLAWDIWKVAAVSSILRVRRGHSIALSMQELLEWGRGLLPLRDPIVFLQWPWQ